MEAARDDGITQAMRCIRAMAGKDEATRHSLWRAAVKYMRRDREGRTVERIRPSFPHAQLGEVRAQLSEG
jgi:hypothetical protein